MIDKRYRSQYQPCAPDKTEIYAERMRYRPTQAESRLHNALLDIFAAYITQPIHQYIIGPYIADFKVKNLIIEVDGPTHAGREDYDKRRTTFMQNRGYRVLRISNADVYIDSVKEAHHIFHLTGPHQLKTIGSVPITHCPPGSAIHGKHSPSKPAIRIIGWNDPKRKY